jgi:soluble lytic murein transglycosylase-like protein
LQAIAKVESSYRPYAMNRTHANRTASVDIGLMQINSRWIHKGPLKQMGYTQASLLDACTNVKVGAWLLADLIRVHGSMGDGLWEAVGAYNAACTNLKGLDCIRARRVYAWKVYRAMRSMARVSSS